MKVDLTGSQISLLGIACDEEVLYYGRCVVQDGVVDANGGVAWQKGRKLGENSPNQEWKDMEKEVQKTIKKQISEYSALSDQLKKGNTDFTIEQIDAIKHMIHDMPLQFAKHIVVKRQIDSTVTFNYVNKFMEIGLESAKKLYLSEFAVIENKLDGAY